MIKATVSYFDGRPAQPVVIGQAEEVFAPRGLAALGKQGLVLDEGGVLTFKAFLALKRQGDIDANTQFEEWASQVEELDVKPTRKQLEAQVLTGALTQEQADGLLALYGDAEGEVKAQPAS